jgi:hypothetical protein
VSTLPDGDDASTLEEGVESLEILEPRTRNRGSEGVNTPRERLLC